MKDRKYVNLAVYYKTADSQFGVGNGRQFDVKKILKTFLKTSLSVHKISKS